MTGLDHTRDVIVEIATIVTDDELVVVAEGPDLVVHQPDDVLAGMDPFVRRHAHEVGAARRHPGLDDDPGAGRRRDARLHPAHVPGPDRVPLCGNSIGTDRRFLAAYLPEIEAALHYRSIDVSSVKELVRRWYPKVRQDRPQKQGQHRALDDIRDSIEELRYYRERVFVPAETERGCGDPRALR